LTTIQEPTGISQQLKLLRALHTTERQQRIMQELMLSILLKNVHITLASTWTLSITTQLIRMSGVLQQPLVMIVPITFRKH